MTNPGFAARGVFPGSTMSSLLCRSWPGDDRHELPFLPPVEPRRKTTNVSEGVCPNASDTRRRRSSARFIRGGPVRGAAARSVGFVACLVRPIGVPPPAEPTRRGRGHGRAASAAQRPSGSACRQSGLRPGLRRPAQDGHVRPGHCSLRHHRSAGTPQK